MLSIDKRIETEVVQNKIDRFLNVGGFFMRLIELYAVAEMTSLAHPDVGVDLDMV